MTQKKLLQVFLSKTQTPGPGVYEVSIDDNDNLSCTCSGWTAKATCKHTRFVNARIESNGGTYPLEISDRASTEEADLAQRSDEAFRSFIIRFGKIEVY